MDFAVILKSPNLSEGKAEGSTIGNRAAVEYVIIADYCVIR
jgi:hypothetical protein